ncbi:MAG: hypothetical protein HY051_00270 [Candidatus Aenigmarchaeota archaeon]|nr:hypothetical protein [Candidatus Aenigmarchaeota archaeon]
MKKKKKDKERIEELEKKTEKLEKEKEKKPEISSVEELVGNFIPGLGKFVSKLIKASPELQKRVEETDKEIKSRLEKGWSGKPRIEYSYSVRTLVTGEIPKKEEDIKTIVVWEETPPVEESDLKVYPIGKKLIIETKDGKYRKEVPLKCYVKDVEIEYRKGEEKGFLSVKMKKR